MTMSTENVDANNAAAAGQDDGEEVNWNAAKEFFSQRIDDGEDDGEGEDEGEGEGEGEGDDEGEGEGTDDGSNTGDDASDDGDLVEIHVKGQAMLVPPQFADAFEKYRREQRERDGRLGGENSQLKERLARLEGILESGGRQDQKKSGPQKPPASLALTDIEEWDRQNEAYIDAKVDQKIAQLRDEGTQKEQQQAQIAAAQKQYVAWANKFYATHDHLDHPVIRPVVGQVFREHLNELREFGDDYEGAFDHLAKLATARVKGIMALNKKNNQRAPKLLTSSKSGRKPTAKPEEVKEFSTADWQAKKRENLRL